MRERGENHHPRLDGDSDHPSLSEVRKFARKEGYKKVRIVSMTEGDKEIKV